MTGMGHGLNTIFIILFQSLLKYVVQTSEGGMGVEMENLFYGIV